ncbi:MAG: nuclear transport factor 2 family protein [Angustibacter sp.]
MNDTEAVVEAALDYFEGWYDGDVARVDRALHAQLVKRSVDQVVGNHPSATSKERILELVRAGAGIEDRTSDPIEVTVVDVHCDVAAAVVRSAQYREYLHLVRTPDGWKIAGTLWQLTHPEQSQP